SPASPVRHAWSRLARDRSSRSSEVDATGALDGRPAGGPAGGPDGGLAGGPDGGLAGSPVGRPDGRPGPRSRGGVLRGAFIGILAPTLGTRTGRPTGA